jgi:hypothetical protein
MYVVSFIPYLQLFLMCRWETMSSSFAEFDGQDRIIMKTEIESSLRNVVFWIKNKTLDNVQNCDSYINIPSSQTYKSYNTGR